MDQDGLRKLEDQCIQEHLPACMTACPARVDAKAICAQVARGDFVEAFKILRKTIPFPGIISHICDEPCKEKCVRKDVGDPLSLKLIENACVNFSSVPDRVTVLPAKSKKLAIIGAGLCGLTVAYDLTRKGYQVTIFEKENRIGGNLWKYPEAELHPSIIEKDFLVFQNFPINIVVETKITTIAGTNDKKFIISDNEFDAVFIGIGQYSDETFGLKTDNNLIIVDPLTFETNVPGIFCGGGAIFKGDVTEKNQTSPISLIAEGHRSATSIDRYMQNVSMSASRILEGSYETRLFTSLVGIDPLPKINPISSFSGFTPEEAKEEAARCLQCECLECVKVCEYLKEYGNYPKRYAREIYNNLSIVKGERRKNQFINSCSLCGLCAEVCPTDFDMGSLCLESRREMVTQKRMPTSAHDFALRDMQFSNGDNFSLVRADPGTDNCGFLFFPGCQMAGSNPEYVESIYAKLRETPEFGTAGVGLALRCCGAPADWAGREDLFSSAKTEFLSEYKKIGNPVIILACSTCFQVFKKYYPEITVRSLWPILEELTPEKITPNTSSLVSVHDPCTTRYEKEIQDSVRSIICKSGFQIEELPFNREKTECCSYGGLMWLANKELAEKVIDRRINENDLPFVTYCIMCRDFFLKQGKPTFHILDILYNKNDTVLPLIFNPPDYSTRHKNRAGLKRKLLSDIWGETMEVKIESLSMPLSISENIRNLMEERLILVEDVVKVIAHYELTGLVLENQKSQHLLSYYCPDYVTYWVEFSKENNSYVIHNTYSHRMSILGTEQK